LTVQVITDSTADLPQQIQKDMGIRVVPIYVRFGDKTYRDGIDITNKQFFDMLSSSSIHPATSQPNPEDFASVYKEYCDTAEGIVSIHISSRISGTFNSANIAKKTMKSRCEIEVIDSNFNSGGLGLVVLAAARLAQKGAGFNEVIIEARKAIREVHMFGMFETMKYLARSGRVSKTIASASQFLHVMPLLTFHNGEIIRAGLIRSVTKGIDHIQEYVIKRLPLSELIIVHSMVEDKAIRLKKILSNYMSQENISIMQLGSALGVHGGPGVLLVAIRK